MRAAFYEQNGPAADVLQVGMIDDPRPGPGEVRVRLKTSGVNPSDVKSRGGITRKIAFPRVVPHSDGAGDIDAVGDGVPQSRIGERVWLWNGQWKRAFGTAAEFIVLPAAQAVPLPAGVSYEAGACLGIPAMTAWQVVSLAGIGPGTTVLVSGGAGAVSHYAIQFAKARGATVLTTISSPAKAAIAQEAGADHAIDYKHEDVAGRVAALTDRRGVDAVIELDLTANAALLPKVLRPRGTVVVYGTGPQAQIPATVLMFIHARLLFTLVYDLTDAERAAAVAGISGMLQANTLRHNIAATYPLEQIVDAHLAVESGKVPGNVVVRL